MGQNKRDGTACQIPWDLTCRRYHGLNLLHAEDEIVAALRASEAVHSVGTADSPRAGSGHSPPWSLCSLENTCHTTCRRPGALRTFHEATTGTGG